MKILHIIDSLGLGGAQTVVKGIFEAQKSNKNLFLFALRKREINIEINHPNIFIYPSTKRYSLKPLKELRNLIEKEKIDVLHCHLFRSQFFGWILKKYSFPEIKLIFHEHGEIFQNHKIYNYFMKQSKKYINLYIAVSKATKNELIKKANILENKIKVLYNFVDTKRFNRKNIKVDIKKEKERLGIKKDEFVMGFVGRLAKVKGCEYLIKALPYLNFSYKVLIAGNGPERKRLEELARKLRVKDKVIFLGYIEKPENVYVLMDVLVMPSLNEANPMSLHEANLLSIKVIGNDIPSIKEFIENRQNGLIYKLNNEKDLAKTILYSYKHKNRKNIKLNKNFLLNFYLKNLNKMYKNDF